MYLLTRNRVALRRWLFYLAGVSMLPVLVFSAHVVLEYQRSSREAILADLVDRTRSRAVEVERVLQATTQSLAALAESGAAQAGDWRELHAHARRFIDRERSLQAVTLVDREGRLVFFSGAPYGAGAFAVGDTPSVDVVFQTGRPHVSTAFHRPVCPTPVVAVSVPLRVDGEARYVLRGILRTATFDALLSAKSVPEGWVVGLADSQGVLISRSLNPESFVGRSVAPVFLESMRRGDGRPSAGQTLDGVASTSVVLPVFGGNWYLGVGVADTVLNAPLAASIRHIALLAAVWLALAMALAHRHSNFLIRQVRLLVAFATTDVAVSRPKEGLRIQEFETVLDGIEHTRHRTRQALTEKADAIEQREQVFDLYERAPCGYHSLDRQGHVLRMNETQLRWLGYRLEELVGHPYTDLLTDASRARFAAAFPVFLVKGHVDNLEFELVCQNGSLLPVAVSGSAIYDAEGNMVATRSTVFDLSERKRLEAQLEQLARTDPLTGLGNRRDFEERALHELQRARRLDRPLAVLMLDVDRFKQVNDLHGHAVGDQVLQGVAQACRAQLRDIDLLARLGGEEFAVLLPETWQTEAVDVAERLRASIATQAVTLPSGLMVPCTVSIGVASRETADDVVATILSRADQALYAAKRAGRNRVMVFEPADIVG
ncbi:sensor domain-containing diguanylate cyclase [Sphaerotilus mobilis]|uniref:diguanylate cyclase n=1 Tax=Sphaerotilus mobilis TaxID=47994 RepID=A0A4Q7LS24_9BURK|nr:diguanylate cyclase [Sphaerotilus mobilis]RZS57092.1 PAS domain S-box-containing protein/diguanylate cyclase (GGDEF)-like protein [Sphaerotilus mobilis]